MKVHVDQPSIYKAGGYDKKAMQARQGGERWRDAVPVAQPMAVLSTRRLDERYLQATSKYIAVEMYSYRGDSWSY